MKFIVNKNIAISSTREIVLDNIANLSNWNKWSPWLCLDSDAINEIKDGSLHWNSKLIGKGMITPLSSSGDELHFDLTFFSPFKSKASVTFTVTTQNAQTNVNWHMVGNLPFFMFFFKKFMTIMVGKDYERGLLRLKNVCELGTVPAKLEFVDEVFSVDGFKCMGLAAKGSFSGVAAHMTETFTRLHNIVAEENLTPKRMICFCEKVMFVKDIIQYSAAIDVDDNSKVSKLAKSQIPAHSAIKVTLHGDYKFLADAWSGLYVHTRGLKLAVNKQIPPYEVYIKGPHNCDNPADYITEIYMPIKE